MEASRLWCCCVLLVFVVSGGPGCSGATTTNSSVECTNEPNSIVGFSRECTCEVGCDTDRNLHCIDGRCLCTPDSVVFNQTCLLKSRYNESCEVDQQCPDLHQLCGALGRCNCLPGYAPTVDTESSSRTICRPLGDEGVLGSNCTTVADCNWQLEHVTCSESICRCRVFYYGEIDSTECRSREWSVDVTWIVTVSVVAAAVIAVGLALLLSCTIKECYRSHKRMRGKVIAVHGPADMEKQPPPPYITVINSKPPAYGPPPAEMDCMDNYGFTSCELEPYSVKS